MSATSLFFTLFARQSIPGRFIPLFYLFHGLSTSQIGILLSICNFSSLLASPMLSYTADSLNRHNILLVVTQLISFLFFMLQPIGYILNTFPFLIMTFCMAVAVAAHGPSYSIVSALSLDDLSKQYGHERGPLYFGSVRLWGAVSWAIGNFFLGVILDYVDYFWNEGSSAAYPKVPLLIVIYGLYPVVSFLFVVTVIYDGLKRQTIKSEKIENAHVEGDIIHKGLEINQKLLQNESMKSHDENIDLITNGRVSGGSAPVSNSSHTSKQKSEDRLSNKSTDVLHRSDYMSMEKSESLYPDSKPSQKNTSENIKYKKTPEIHSEFPIVITDMETSENLTLLNALRPVIFCGGIWTALFFFLLFNLNIGMSIVENLCFVFFRDELSASFTVCGISVFITVIFEIILFAYAERVLDFVGAPSLLIIGTSSYFIRALGYSLSRSAYLTLFLEPLHGLTYAAVHSSSVAIICERAPRKYAATAQSLLTFISGVSSVIGTFFGGFVIEYYGSRLLYFSCSISVLISTIAFSVVVYIRSGDSIIDEEDRYEVAKSNQTKNEKV